MRRLVTNQIITIDDKTAGVVINSNRFGVFEATVDMNLIHRVLNYRWGIMNLTTRYHFYAVTRKKEDRKLLFLHHLIAGRPNPPLEIDHIDRDPLNNRLSNLRAVSKQGNLLNQNASGTGFDKRINKWFARIRINYKVIWLGAFDTKEEAEEIYQMTKKEIERNIDNLY